MKKLMFLGLLFLGLTAFAQEKKSDTKADEQAIRDISKKWLEMQKKNDVAGISVLFADDGTSYSTNMDPAVGPAAIKKAYTDMQQKNPKREVDWSTERVDVAASGDLAVEYGKYHNKNMGPNGTDSDEGKYITVYKKINGAWKVFADVGSSTKPKK